MHEQKVGNSIWPMDFVVWQQQLSDCQRATQPKDRLLHRLVQVPNAPPG